MSSQQDLRLDALTQSADSGDSAQNLSLEGQDLLAQTRAAFGTTGEPEFLVLNSVFDSNQQQAPRGLTDRGQTVSTSDQGGDVKGTVRPVERSESTSALPPVNIAENDRPNPPRQWTMAIDLTASGSVESNGRRVPTGAANKLDTILGLAEQTRGVPVTMYVQSILPLEQREDPNNPGSFSSNLNDLQVATYRLENGQATLVERGPNQGFQRNLERLLDRASQRAGDGNLGLIIQSHGFATQGVGGESGRASLDELESAIRSGLRTSGRTDLDLLNFDSCNMGNIDVAQAMQGEARNVVASSEVERAFGDDVDGQNMRATLGAILENPNLTPSQYAARSVELARSGANDDAGNVRSDAAGTETLAHYDVSSYPQVERSVDGLGQALHAASRSPENRAAIIDLVSRVPQLDNDVGSSNSMSPQRRDLGLFLNAVEQAITDGRISDADSRIRTAIGETRQSLGQLVRSYHGENYNSYAQMSGVSTFLPGGDILDLDARARNGTPFQQMRDWMTMPKTSGFGNREQLADTLQHSARQVIEAGGSDVLLQRVQAVGSASDQAQFRQAMTALETEITAIEASPAGQNILQANRQRLEQSRDRLFEENLRRSPAGWREFVSSLRR